MALNVLKSGSPLKLKVAASDPVSAESGEMYYNSTDQLFRVFENGSWQHLASRDYVDTHTLAIGNSVSGATPGSILFADGSSHLGQNNSALYYDYTNVRLGVGTNTPAFSLHVATPASDTGVVGSVVVDGTALGLDLIAVTAANNSTTKPTYYAVNTSTGPAMALNSQTTTGAILQLGNSAGSVNIGLSGTGFTPYSLLLPTDAGTLGQVLTTDGTGVTSWTSPAGFNIGSGIGSATQGSVLFAGAAGVLAQDNAKLFWDDTNHNLGIGNSAPTHHLHIGPAPDGSVPASGELLLSGTQPTLRIADSSHVLYMDSNTALNSAQISTFDYATSTPFQLCFNGNGGNVGVRSLSPGSQLSVQGNAAIGGTYHGTAAPTDGLIVEGNVGIGTSAVAAGVSLHVAQAIDINHDTWVLYQSLGGHLLTLTGSGGTNGGGPSGNTLIDFSASKDLHFTSSTDTNLSGLSSHMVIRGDNGNVGIGTNSPLSPLHVVGTTRCDGDFLSIAGNHQTWNSASVTKAVSMGMNNPGDPITDDMIFSLFSGGWSEKMRLTQDGKVGIGTGSPTFALDVVADTSSGLRVTNNNSGELASILAMNDLGHYTAHDATGSTFPAGIYGPDKGVFYGAGFSGGTVFLSDTGPLQLASATAVNLTMTQAGNIGIGTESPSSLFSVGSTSQFQVDSTGNAKATSLSLMDGSTGVLDTYKNGLTLTASTTAVLAGLTFAFATYGGQTVDYRITEATTGAVRVGALMVATDGTSASITDTYTETADVGVTWTAAISGTDVQLSYTTTANDKTMHAQLKQFLAT